MWLRLFKLCRLCLHIIAGLFLLLKARPPKDSLPIDDRLVKTRRQWLAKGADILGVEIVILGKPSTETCVMVSNHISWLDILILGATTDASFLSKEEISRWPLIGQLAKKSGTLFIARGQRKAMQQARDDIKLYLKHNFPVIFFPEGTTTDGLNVKKFHSPLFSVAVDSQLPIQPISIHYPDHQEPDQRVAFIDDDDFIRHAWKVLKYPRIPVTVQFLPTIQMEENTTKQIAALAQQSVRESLQHISP